MIAARANALAARPLAGARAPVMAPLRPSLAITRAPVSARAGKDLPELDTEELLAKVKVFASDTTATLKAKWEKTEDKPAAVLIGAGTLIALTFALNIVNTVDKIPLVSDFVELVGIGVTGWFTYRYLTVGPDRDELFVTIKSWINKVYGTLTKN